MEFAELKELLSIFEESSIREFDLQKDDVTLYLSKNEQSRHQGNPTVEISPEPTQAAVVTTEPADGPVAIETTQGKTVDSPIVGVVYLSGSPEEAAFKVVGDSVKIGDTLCIVEAMKIMNEIVSDVAGTITDVLVENENVVEYGQPLFRIV